MTMIDSSSENFNCPYCGGENMLIVDSFVNSSQSFVQDCEVCCKPIVIQLRCRSGEILELRVRREN